MSKETLAKLAVIQGTAEGKYTVKEAGDRKMFFRRAACPDRTRIADKSI